MLVQHPPCYEQPTLDDYRDYCRARRAYQVILEPLETAEVKHEIRMNIERDRLTRLKSKPAVRRAQKIHDGARLSYLALGRAIDVIKAERWPLLVGPEYAMQRHDFAMHKEELPPERRALYVNASSAGWNTPR